MFACPTFNGLRISLSEKSRFEYSHKIPCGWAEYIQQVYLNNEKISINVNLTPGLNVVIGGSSSGKTLFVDSVYKKYVQKLKIAIIRSMALEKSEYKILLCLRLIILTRILLLMCLWTKKRELRI
jgi:hypothetical protein